MRKLYFGFLFCLLSVFSANAQNCLVIDKPDINFLDENSDGIDGDTNRAVFVSDQTGNDANNGSMSAPLKSLTMAMAKANAGGKDIYVAAGTYTIYAPLIVFDGVGIYGYFSATTWARNRFNKVIIQGTENVIYIKGNTKNSCIQGVEIVASNATGNGVSSHAIFIDSCAGSIMLLENTIRAGKGSAGFNGSNGVGGASGGNGGNGTNGMCDGNIAGTGGAAGFSSCAPGGKGGNGGVYTQNGQAGAVNSAGNPGGSGGASGDPGKVGNNGNNGVNGTSGVSAFSNNIIHDVLISGVKGSKGFDGTDGGNGTSGCGGGGGGGQHCTLCTDGSGNGGGGGGGAGCKGFGGKGGFGGGSSIAVFVRDARVYLENNKLFTQSAGNGGNGGDGGIGGTGGTGGNGATNCVSEVGAGGNGGNGGNGGDAGAGSGGNGGSSVAVFAQGAAQVFQTANTFTLGASGMGGVGGAAVNMANGALGFNGIAKNIEGASSNTIADIQGALCIEDASVVRYKNSMRDAVLQVVLSEPSPKEVRVSYSFTNGTAVDGSDFVLPSGTLSFLPYNTIQSLPFKVTADIGDTTKRKFTVTLSNVVGSATLSRPTATVTILPYAGASIDALNKDIVVSHYPNPFSSSTTIKVSGMSAEVISVVLYNNLGQPLRTLNSGTGELGVFELQANGLQAGVYYYEVQADGVGVVKKALILMPQ